MNNNNFASQLGSSDSIIDMLMLSNPCESWNIIRFSRNKSLKTLQLGFIGSPQIQMIVPKKNNLMPFLRWIKELMKQMYWKNLNTEKESVKGSKTFISFVEYLC